MVVKVLAIDGSGTSKYGVRHASFLLKVRTLQVPWVLKYK